MFNLFDIEEACYRARQRAHRRGEVFLALHNTILV